MTIEVLYFDGCPKYLPTLDRLQAVLRQEGVTAEVRQIEVKDVKAAKALDFFGSPTIRVNGVDIDPAARTLVARGLACRTYVGGLPSEEMIRTALREARES